MRFARGYHQRETTVFIDNGHAKVGRNKTHDSDITVGENISDPISIPPNASALDTLAVASMMTPEQIADSGLRERLENAQKRMSSAVGVALSALREFDVSSPDLSEIVDRKVAEAAEIIRKAVAKDM